MRYAARMKDLMELIGLALFATVGVLFSIAATGFIFYWLLSL